MLRKATLTIDQLCDLFLSEKAPQWQKPKTGRPTDTFKVAANCLSQFCEFRYRPSDAGWQVRVGNLPVDQMSAKVLYEWQQALARSRRLRRTTIDGKFVYYVRYVFNWAAEPVRDLVDESIPARLRVVRQLRYGRSPALEPKAVLSVSREDVEAVCQYADERLATMLRVHWHTGARPGEICQMARTEIDRAYTPWHYQPVEHKSELTKKRRLILIGPEGRQVLGPWMDAHPGKYLFANPPGCRAAGKPMNANSYREAVQRIQRRHGLRKWNPQQIRHSFATRVQRETRDRGAAQLLLDHSSAQTTEHYLDPDTQRKIELAERFG